MGLPNPLRFLRIVSIQMSVLLMFISRQLTWNVNLFFYQNALRLELNWREEMSAGLGVGGHDPAHLTQIENGKRYRGVPGLYHFAILFLNRRELARPG
jgi:catechol-2,3-dioxygenase